MKKLIKGADKSLETKTLSNYINVDKGRPTKRRSYTLRSRKIESAEVRYPAWWDDPDYDMGGRRIPQPSEVPAADEYIYLDVEDIIIVDDRGNWGFEENTSTSQPWGRGDGSSGDWEYPGEDYNLTLRDWGGAVEDAMDLIDTQIIDVMKPPQGKYKLECNMELAYSIGGVQMYQSFGRYEEEYEVEYDTSDSDVIFRPKASTVSNVKLTPLDK